MRNFSKNLCIILSLLLIVSFVFSCTSRGFDFESFVSDKFFGSESEKNETSTSNKPNVNPFSNVTMVCLGDSITMATKVDCPYPTVVKNMLGMKEVYNHGVSWSTLAYIDDCHCHPQSEYNHDPYVFRSDKLEEADIIAVMGGVNDWGCLIPLGDIDDIEPTTFYGALNILITDLKSNYPDSYIFFMTGFDYYGVNNVDAYNRDKVYWREFNEAIVVACEKHNVDCFDVFHEIPINRDFDMIDGVHPTQEFISNIWSPAIADFIRENYKK